MRVQGMAIILFGFLFFGCSRGGEIECLGENGETLFRGHYDFKSEDGWYVVRKNGGTIAYSFVPCHELHRPARTP